MDEAGLSVDAGSLGQLDHDQLEQLNHEDQFDFEAEGFDFNLDGAYDAPAPVVTEDGTGNEFVETETSVNNIEVAVSQESGTTTDDIGAMVKETVTVAAVTDNDEIGYEDEEDDIQLGSTQPGEIGTAEETQDLSSEARPDAEAKEPENENNEANEAVVDYQDEIGYEDDELGVADISIDLKSEQATEPIADAAVEQPHEQSGHSQEANANNLMVHSDVEVHTEQVEDNAISDEQSEPVEPAADEGLDDHHMDDDKENVVDMNKHDGAAGEEYHDEEEYEDQSMLENYFVDEDEDISQGPSDLDKAIEDLTNSLPSIPEVEVLYNDGSYSLFGAPDDDPETYFLSGTNHLKNSLGELLSSLRQVLSEEIRPTDELLVSVEALGLEFGERSNEKFLARSLRELLDCHAALAAKNYGDFPTQPTLRLMVQQDCEEQFLQLLQEVELEAESSDNSEELDASEPHDEWPLANSLGDEQDDDAAQADLSEHSESHGSSATDDETTSVPPVSDAGPAALNEETDHADSSMEQGFSFEDTLDDPEYQASEDGDASRESPDEHMEDHTDEEIDDHSEENIDDHLEENINDQVEENAEEPVEGEAVAITAQEHVSEATQLSKTSDDTAAVTPHEEVHLEQTSDEATIDVHAVEQEVVGQSGDVFNNDAVTFEDLDEYIAASTEGGEHLGVFNDDELMLGYDNDAGLSTIEEREDEEYDDVTATLNIDDNAKHNNPDSAHDIENLENGNLQLGTPEIPAVAGDAESIHTSTTINGDEIDYEEHDAADDSFTPGASIQQSAAPISGQPDEIDWENDGLEDNEIEHNGVDTSFASEEQKEVTLTPSSLAAKRSRTDEAESLAEESDNKRRRT
ncbi:hypothetical protein QBC38DRAFT_11026 [Podospora fimiseda]|uniref:Uncharacterized protein n=1 Tax=Podospora fimiseda TaxID=252190 RepID=A0AAN7BWF7_9PEZI|nr:hypothetical protein QBC38DRAFT_11026 [Podospora fimiseda]